MASQKCGQTPGRPGHVHACRPLALWFPLARPFHWTPAGDPAQTPAQAAAARKARGRELAASLTPELRRQRALLMLEYGAQVLGLTEVRCPGCEGNGWEDVEALVKCPLCKGFQWVPYRIALLMNGSDPSPFPGALASVPRALRVAPEAGLQEE